jgi:hypothetical protein
LTPTHDTVTGLASIKSAKAPTGSTARRTTAPAKTELQLWTSPLKYYTKDAG